MSKSSAATDSGIRYIFMTSRGRVLIKDPMYMLHANGRTYLYSMSISGWLYIYDPKAPFARLPSPTTIGNHFTIGKSKRCIQEDQPDTIDLHKTVYTPIETPDGSDVYKRSAASCNFSIDELCEKEKIADLPCVSCGKKQGFARQRFSVDDVSVLQDVLKFGAFTGGADKKYISIHGKKYKVHVGPKGGKYIVYMGKKKYISQGGSSFNFTDVELKQLKAALDPGNKCQISIFHNNETAMIMVEDNYTMRLHKMNLKEPLQEQMMSLPISTKTSVVVK